MARGGGDNTGLNLSEQELLTLLGEDGFGAQKELLDSLKTAHAETIEAARLRVRLTGPEDPAHRRALEGFVAGDVDGLLVLKSEYPRGDAGKCGRCSKVAGYEKVQKGPRAGHDNRRRPTTSQRYLFTDPQTGEQIQLCVGCWREPTYQGFVRELALAKNLYVYQARNYQVLNDKDYPLQAWPKISCRKCEWVGNLAQVPWRPLERTERRTELVEGETLYPGGCPACKHPSWPRAWNDFFTSRTGTNGDLLDVNGRGFSSERDLWFQIHPISEGGHQVLAVDAELPKAAWYTQEELDAEAAAKAEREQKALRARADALAHVEQFTAVTGLDPRDIGNRPREWFVVDEPGTWNDDYYVDVKKGDLIVCARDGAENPIDKSVEMRDGFQFSFEDNGDSTYRYYVLRLSGGEQFAGAAHRF